MYAEYVVLMTLVALPLTCDRIPTRMTLISSLGSLSTPQKLPHDRISLSTFADHEL